MKRTISTSLVMGLIVGALLTTSALGQNTGELLGSVTDADGGGLPHIHGRV